MIPAAEAPMSAFAETITSRKYAHDYSGRKENWPEIARRVVGNVVKPFMPDLVDPLTRLIESRKFMPGGRYLYAAGRRYPQVNNCFLFRVGDSREEWGKLLNKTTNALMTGGGVGVVYSDLRGEGIVVKGMGGTSTGPCALMQIVNESGRHIMQGGSRRSAIWAGLVWNHPDIFKFIHLKNWSEDVKAAKLRDFNFAAPMDGTNISVILNTRFFLAYHTASDPEHELAHRVYWAAVRQGLETAEPGFSVDIGENEGENLRNACTEVTSRDDGDCCNLASLNLARFRSLDEFEQAVPLAVAFLMCGTLYSKLPVPEMYDVREKNRRLGLGLMGVHDWLLRRGYRYEPNDELGQWMGVYARSGIIAKAWADSLGVTNPVATRSIAPTGTISIVAETTSGIEPIFAAAYKRRYLHGKDWKFQYVLDATAKNLVDAGVDPDLIEDAYTLSEDVERRIKFQCWMQRYVDHGISSTINLPSWGSSVNNESTVKKFGDTLMEHLPHLRGVTMYPDGCRGGQPLNRVSYRDAVAHIGVEHAESSSAPSDMAKGDSCKEGFCSS